jgi:DNA polymerase-3 subunit epsilon
MTREIVLDTETTGLSPLTGDRIVELGCVELLNHVPTGNHYHVYINPERTMTAEAYEVHGISEAFLRDKPRFGVIAPEFLRFIGDSTLIIHNAPFDIGFLNHELERARLPAIRNKVIDTVELAHEKHPGARVSLDALCKHYDIDNSKRTLHGALLDARILADVYLELIGGRQVAFALIEEETVGPAGLEWSIGAYVARRRPEPLPRRITAEEIAAHQALIASLGPEPLWSMYLDVVEGAAAA